MKLSRGYTLVEVVIVALVGTVVALTMVEVFVPQLDFLFFSPQRTRIYQAGDDLLGMIVEGDDKARGLRFAGPLSAGASAVTAASADALTYTYLTDTDASSHTIVLTYDSVARQAARQIDGGGAEVIPYYAAAAASRIVVDRLENNSLGSPAFFRYYDSSGTEFSGTPVTNIYRVDIPIQVSAGGGGVTGLEGQAAMKTGVEIKRYTT
ncbi:MAG: hypothetical protein HY593_02855 [Candidatus Omnitrophica bacterium]|nr:hypothetical protein [Candidatus Omnitrophota bacterium]